MSLDFYEDLRFGSAGFADIGELRRPGLHRRGGFFIGCDERGRAYYSDQQAGILLCGGARSGKGNFIQPWQVDGSYPHHIINMDWKGQGGPIGQLQVRQRRRVINFAPRGAGTLATHRINGTPYLRADSPTLRPDAKFFAASWIPYSGSAQAQYFEGTAQRITEAVTVTQARLKGSVILPELADVMAGLGAASDEWLSFEFEMTNSPDASVRQVAEDLQRMREQGRDSSGFGGIKNEIAKAFACMSDPQLREALSPPFDFCFSELTAEDGPPYMVNIMEAMEFAETSAPVIKALYTAALIYKRRAITSRPQFWCLDEIGNIGPWPLAVGLATFGAGYGIRPAYIVQSTAQLDNIAPRGSEIIPNSCGTQIYMGTRSLSEASLVSKLLGKRTLEFDDTLAQERARAARRQALAKVVMGGADPLASIMDAAHQSRAAVHRTKMARDLRTPDEIINDEPGRAYVFMPGVLSKPFYAYVPRYWQRRDLAGKYLGDPFHSRPGTVEIATLFGQRHRKVITAPCPERYADWPQYRESGLWSYVKGFRP